MKYEWLDSYLLAKSGAEHDKLGGLVQHSGKLLFHPQRGTAPVDVAGKGQKLLLREQTIRSNGAGTAIWSEENSLLPPWGPLRG